MFCHVPGTHLAMSPIGPRRNETRLRKGWSESAVPATMRPSLRQIPEDGQLVLIRRQLFGLPANGSSKFKRTMEHDGANVA